MGKLCVYVVEDHNEALEGIYREIGRKQLPMSGCYLLHFDSHSDLSIPKNLSAEDVFNKDSLFSAITIENWIIPAVFAGHIGTVVWVKPPWTLESFERFSQMKVGFHSKSGEIRVSSSSNHFLSELSFAPEDEMTNSKPLDLFVFPFGGSIDEKETELHQIPRLVTVDDATKCSGNIKENSLSKEIDKILESGSKGFILDIDLDFFSTTSPLETMLTTKQRRLLEAVYKYVAPADRSEKSVVDCMNAREEQLSYLSKVMSSAQSNETLNLGNSKRDQQLLELIEDLKRNAVSKERIDFEWLHEIGTGIDDCELPHHISSPAEIDHLLVQMEETLRFLPKPSVITVAR